MEASCLQGCLEKFSSAKPEDLDSDALSFDFEFNVPMLPTVVGQSFIGAFHLDGGRLVVPESNDRPFVLTLPLYELLSFSNKE